MQNNIIFEDESLSTYNTRLVYYSLHRKIKDSLKQSEIQHTRKCVLDILKTNSDINVKNMYTNLYELFCNDGEIKEFIIESKNVH